jgi:formate--tetrahydrofolate ligase
VAINRFPSDTEAEISLLQEGVAHQGAQVVLTNHWAKGGAGAEELAYAIVDTVERVPARFRFVYDEEDGLWDKISAVATKIYGASEVVADTRVRRQIHKFQEDGYGRYPVCIAKTQYSFSTDPSLRGAPSGHVLPIREVRLCAGAEFVVAVCGDIMTMPGLPKSPASERIDLGKNGEVIGLF